MSSIAFFDLDLTLLSCNSATLWLKRQLREGHISRLDALKMAGWIGMYQMGMADIESVVRKAIGGLEGKDEHDIRTRTEVFWAEEVVNMIRPEARTVLEQHRTAGDALVLLTEWEEFRNLQWSRIVKGMLHPTLLDGRNFYDPKKMKQEGFTYRSIGRP